MGQERARESSLPLPGRLSPCGPLKSKRDDPDDCGEHEEKGLHFSQLLGVVMEEPFRVEHQSLQSEERHGDQDAGTRTVTRTEARRQGGGGDGQVRSDSTGDMEMKRAGHQNREDRAPTVNGMTGGHGMEYERYQQAQGKEDQQNPGAPPVRTDQQWKKRKCHPCDSRKCQPLP